MWLTALMSLAFSAQLQLVGALFQYSDAQGNQHIVSDADLVPPRFRRNVQILDDEGQVLGDLDQNSGAKAQAAGDLERLKQRGRGQKNSKKKSSQRLLEELLYDESADEDDLGAADSGAKPSTKKSNSDKKRVQPFKAPEGSPAWVLLAVGLVFIIMALRVLQGFLKVLAFACGVMALLMFVSDEYGDTAVGSKVKVATEGIVKPLKKVQEAAGDKVSGPLKAPYEIIDKVRGAVDGHAEAAEERNAILEKLSEGN